MSTKTDSYRHQGLFTFFAAGSLVLELGAPLALLDRRLGRPWARATFGMHWDIRMIMGVRFRYHLSGVSLAGWFDLERLPRLLAGQRAGR